LEEKYDEQFQVVFKAIQQLIKEEKKHPLPFRHLLNLTFQVKSPLIKGDLGGCFSRYYQSLKNMEEERNDQKG